MSKSDPVFCLWRPPSSSCQCCTGNWKGGTVLIESIPGFADRSLTGCGMKAAEDYEWCSSQADGGGGRIFACDYEVISWRSRKRQKYFASVSVKSETQALPPFLLVHFCPAFEHWIKRMHYVIFLESFDATTYGIWHDLCITQRKFFDFVLLGESLCLFPNVRQDHYVPQRHLPILHDDLNSL